MGSSLYTVSIGLCFTIDVFFTPPLVVLAVMVVLAFVFVDCCVARFLLGGVVVVAFDDLGDLVAEGGFSVGVPCFGGAAVGDGGDEGVDVVLLLLDEVGGALGLVGGDHDGAG